MSLVISVKEGNTEIKKMTETFKMYNVFLSSTEVGENKFHIFHCKKVFDDSQTKLFESHAQDHGGIHKKIKSYPVWRRVSEESLVQF